MKSKPSKEFPVKDGHDPASFEHPPAAGEKPVSLKAILLARSRFMAITLVLCAVLILVSSYCFIDSFSVGAKNAMDQYVSVKDEVSKEVYESYYQKSFKRSEEKHHVSNRVAISLGSLKEEAKLEVLKISDVEYVTPETDEGNIIENVLGTISHFFVGNVESWLEVPGFGVFTVDLSCAEFIVDEQRSYVLVRIPEPVLSEFTIDYANVELLNFEDSGIFKNSARVGEEVARKQLQSAELKMRQNANSNQDFYRSAKESAEKVLKNLIEQLNPSLTDLTVEIEFLQ